MVIVFKTITFKKRPDYICYPDWNSSEISLQLLQLCPNKGHEFCLSDSEFNLIGITIKVTFKNGSKEIKFDFIKGFSPMCTCLKPQ